MPSPLDADAAEAIRAELLAVDPAEIMSRSGLEPDPWQLAILTGSWRQLAILGARQGAGKTTTVAMLHLAEMLRPNRWTYVGGPSERQSKKIVEKVATLCLDLGLIGSVVDKAEIQRTRVSFRNGSFVQALSSNQSTARGNTAHLFTVTEAAFASDAFIDAVTPSLAVTNGRLVLESTPFGQRGFFWKVWDDGSDDGSNGCPDGGMGTSARMRGWTVARRTWRECSRLTAQFLDDERYKGPMYFSQEYECRFLAAVGSVFSPELIAAAMENGERPLFPLDAPPLLTAPEPTERPLEV